MKTHQRPVLIAHRGDTSEFPENTLRSLISAFDSGADGVEFDVQLDSNGQLILRHDYLVKGEDKSQQLSEILPHIAGRGRLQLDIKAIDLEFLPVLKKSLANYRNTDIEIITNVWPVIPEIRKTFPTLKLGVIFQPSEFLEWMTDAFVASKVVSYMYIMKGDVAHVPWEVIRKKPALIGACHENGFLVHSHIAKGTKDELGVYGKMEKLGIDQCTIGNIKLLQTIKN